MYYTDTTHPYVWHDSLINDTRLTPQCGLAITFFTLICVKSLIHMCNKIHPHAWHLALYSAALPSRSSSFSCICMTFLVLVCGMHDSFTCVKWLTPQALPALFTFLMHICEMTHSCVWLDSFICVTWIIQKYDMTHPEMWHVSFHRAALSSRSSPSSTSTCSTPRVETLKSQLELNFLKKGTADNF